MHFTSKQNQCNSKQENHVVCMTNLKVKYQLQEAVVKHLITSYCFKNMMCPLHNIEFMTFSFSAVSL